MNTSKQPFTNIKRAGVLSLFVIAGTGVSSTVSYGSITPYRLNIADGLVAVVRDTTNSEHRFSKYSVSQQERSDSRRGNRSSGRASGSETTGTEDYRNNLRTSSRPSRASRDGGSTPSQFVRDKLIRGIHDANTEDAEDLLKAALRVINRVQPRTHFIRGDSENYVKSHARYLTQALGMTLELYEKNSTGAALFGANNLFNSPRKGDVIKKSTNPGNIFYHTYYGLIAKVSKARGTPPRGGLTKEEALDALEKTFEKLYPTEKKWEISSSVAKGNPKLALFVVKRALELQAERHNAP